MDKGNQNILGKTPLTATGQRVWRRWTVKLSGYRHGVVKQWPLVLCLWISMLSCHVIANELEVPGQRHSRKPLIGQRYSNDQDGNALDDQLETRLDKAHRDLVQDISKNDKDKAQEQLDTFVEVQLIFTSPVKKSRLDTFKRLGGKIDYLYKAVSYGWNGRIPLKQLRSLTAMLGSELVLVEESKPIQAHLDIATADGRVRPVWAPGFAGSSNGFRGSNSITIAIVDSGVDPNHPDLQDRCVYWNDYSFDNSPTPIDKYHHGSHVAGIATGTGLSSGSGTGTLFYTDRSAPFATFNNDGSFQPNLTGLPDTEVTFTSTARWFGDAPTSLYLFARPKGINAPTYVTNPQWIALSDPNTGYPPLSESNTFAASSDMVYTTALPANMIDWYHLVGRYVITNTVGPITGTADGFNKLSGVAPGCNWAGSKVFTKNGVGQTLWLEAAIDDLVDNRIDKNIKVMNLSLGIIGSPGLSPSLRQKINTAVANGIVAVISAGNDGRNSTEDGRVVDDPGRAAYAITVAASNDENQVTDYSSQGFIDPNNATAQEEDYKPDITAPGGSIYHSYIMSVDSNSGDGGSFADQQPDDYTLYRGTSMASPYIAGCAALVIDALERQNHVWDFNSVSDPMFVKMILTATASETNAPRENGIFNPSLQRALAGPDGFPVGKDPNEGYGLVNADAAIEAVTQEYVLDTTVTDTLGPGLSDKRVWARRVEIPAGTDFEPYLIVPDGADFDIYLYDAQPGLYGQPVLLASSTKEPKPTEDPGIGLNEDQLSYSSQAAFSGLLVVKRVWGSGQFSLTTLTPSHQVTAVSDPNGVIDPSGVFIKKYGSDIHFEAIPDPDYYVDSWFVDGNEVQTEAAGGKSFTLTDITADHTVTVSFKTLVYACTITAVAGPNGTIDPSGTFTLIRQNSTEILSQEFTAIPNPNYQVDCWSVDGVVVQYGGTTFSMLDINNDHTVTVSFKPMTYTLTATAGPNGTIEPFGIFTAVTGSDQMFLATPDSGYQVQTWFVDGIEAQSGGSTYVLSNITTSHDVSVSFEQRLTYDIIAIAGPNGTVDPNGLVTVLTGSDQLFVAAPEPGYKVDSWTLDEVEVQYGGTNFLLTSVQDEHLLKVSYKQLPISISGTVNSLLGEPVEGVSVTADNGGSIDITDPNGFYEVWIDYNWSGTLIPEKSEFVMEPNVIEFVNVLGPIENQSFVARSIYDLDASGWIDLGDLQVFAGYWLLSGPGLPCDYYQDDDNIINLLDFAVFSGRWRWE